MLLVNTLNGSYKTQNVKKSSFKKRHSFPLNFVRNRYLFCTTSSQRQIDPGRVVAFAGHRASAAPVEVCVSPTVERFFEFELDLKREPKSKCLGIETNESVAPTP